MKLTALGLLLASAALVSANPYQYRYQQSYYYPPQTIYLPAYGAGYQVQPGAGEQEQILLKILQELKAMRAESAALRAGASPTAPAHVQVFAARCVQCHESSVAKAKGKGFVLMQGGREVELTPEMRLEVIRRVHEKEMPPDNPLSDEEYSKLVVSLSTRQKPQPQVLPGPKLEKVQDK